MALSDSALITVDDARLYAKLASTDKPTDAWFEAVINGISDQIQAYVGRIFKPSDDSATTKQFSHDGTKLLDIADCHDIELIRISATPNDEDSWLELGASDWVAEPLSDNMKMQIRFAAADGLQSTNVGWGGLALCRQNQLHTEWLDEARAAGSKFLAVEVTAQFGWNTVPGNIQLAAMLWINHMIQRDQAFFSPELAEAVINQAAMPADVKGILDTEQGRQAMVGAV